jgi:hypothetical protein
MSLPGVKMIYPVKFSESTYKALSERASNYPPDLCGQGSKLFVLPDLPLAGIKLSIPVEEYLSHICEVPKACRPKLIDIIPTGDERFPIVVNAPVVVSDGKTLIDGREVTLIV